MIETAQRELQTSGAEHLIPGPATDHPAQLCSLTVMEGEGAFQFNKGQQATSISAAAGERRHPGGSCDAPFHLPQTLSRGLSKDRSELGPYEDLPHEFLRRQCEFTDRTKSFLRRYAHERPTLEHSDGSRSYYIPLHGITYRGLPNNNTDRVKFFRTTMELTVPPDAHNLDQCTFRRGPRV
ncbi:MAG: hypothetical protein K2Z81_22170, partial [Cyanobacteria bacterium]|nr:hypothetical protein [Cyanobacteriota bacterium]